MLAAPLHKVLLGLLLATHLPLLLQESGLSHTLLDPLPHALPDAL